MRHKYELKKFKSRIKASSNWILEGKNNARDKITSSKTNAKIYRGRVSLFIPK